MKEKIQKVYENSSNNPVQNKTLIITKNVSTPNQMILFLHNFSQFVATYRNSLSYYWTQIIERVTPRKGYMKVCTLCIETMNPIVWFEAVKIRIPKIYKQDFIYSK